MSTDTQHLVYHRSRVSDLEHELALARASSDYWREKYIADKDPSNDGFNERLRRIKLSQATKNAIYWYQQAARSPMDECDE